MWKVVVMYQALTTDQKIIELKFRIMIFAWYI
ncbi:MAG: hypothetical protein RL621_1163, partial [Bacteroidota bacterium]